MQWGDTVFSNRAGEGLLSQAERSVRVLRFNAERRVLPVETRGISEGALQGCVSRRLSPPLSPHTSTRINKSMLGVPIGLPKRPRFPAPCPLFLSVHFGYLEMCALSYLLRARTHRKPAL